MRSGHLPPMPHREQKAKLYPVTLVKLTWVLLLMVVVAGGSTYDIVYTDGANVLQFGLQGPP
jgi:hypothetical protein